MKLRLALLTIALAVPVGCSKGGPETYPVTGRIVYQGKPIAEAQIGFVPIDTSGALKPARGQTDADGRYTLSTYLGPGDDASGAMAGSFKVTVAKGLPQNEIVTYEAMSKFISEIPEHYADTARTPLTAEVTPSGGNFDFALEDR